MNKRKPRKNLDLNETRIIAWMLIGYSFFIFYSLLSDIYQNYQMLHADYDGGKSLTDLGIGLDLGMYAVIFLLPVIFMLAGWGLLRGNRWARYLASVLLLMLALLYLLNQTVWPVFRITLPVVLAFCVFVLIRSSSKK